jgi:hypothetical protein
MSNQSNQKTQSNQSNRSNWKSCLEKHREAVSSILQFCEEKLSNCQIVKMSIRAIFSVLLNKKSRPRTAISIQERMAELNNLLQR